MRPRTTLMIAALASGASGFAPRSSPRSSPLLSRNNNNAFQNPNTSTTSTTALNQQLPTVGPDLTPSTLGTPLGMSQIKSIIAVSSCKGGVGKSTTAVNLAYALQSTFGARVGIFDADVYGPSLPTMVTPHDDMVRFLGRQIAPLEREGVKLMSFGYVNEGSAVMRGPMVTQLLDQFLSLTDWGELDYLILDMPPGTGDIQLTLSQRLDISAAVIVTTPQELSFVDVERGVEMFDTVNVPCVAVVENMAYFEKEKSSGSGSNKVVEIDAGVLEERFLEALLQKDDDGVMGMDEKAAVGMAGELVKIVQQNIQNAAISANSNTNDGGDGDNEMEQIRIFGPGHKRRLSEQFGIEHSYSIPLLGQIAQNGDSGTPFILEHPNSPQADIYRQLASSVVSEIAKAKSKGAKRPTVTFNAEEHMLQVNDIRSEESGEAVKDEDEDEDKDSTISPAELRRECRCAACVEELTGKQILDPTSVRETIKPLNMYPTGNYALSVDWSDGHKSLYPYRQIRSLLSAKKESGKKEVVEQ